MGAMGYCERFAPLAQHYCPLSCDLCKAARSQNGEVSTPSAGDGAVQEDAVVRDAEPPSSLSMMRTGMRSSLGLRVASEHRQQVDPNSASTRSSRSASKAGGTLRRIGR